MAIETKTTKIAATADMKATAKPTATTKDTISLWSKPQSMWTSLVS